MECGIKLGIKSITACQAIHLFHRVYRNLDKSEYDKFVVATSCSRFTDFIIDLKLILFDSLFSWQDQQ